MPTVAWFDTESEAHSERDNTNYSSTATYWQFQSHFGDNTYATGAIFEIDELEVGTISSAHVRADLSAESNSETIPGFWKVVPNVSAWGSGASTPAGVYNASGATPIADTIGNAADLMSADLSAGLEAAMDSLTFDGEGKGYVAIIFLATDIGSGAGGSVRWKRFNSTEWGGTPEYVPQLQYDFTSTTTAFKLGGSISSGRAAMRAAALIGRWHGDTVELNPSAKNPFYPKQTAGRGDLPPTDMDTGNPNGTDWALWASGVGTFVGPRTRIHTNIPGEARRPPNTHSIQSEDWAGERATVGWHPDYWQGEFAGDMECCSGRFYMAYAGGGTPDWAVGNWRPTYLTAWRDGSQVWGIDSSDDESTDFQDFYLNAFWPGGDAGDVGPRRTPGNWLRFEFQMSDIPDPRLIVRVYDEDGTTPIFDIDVDPTGPLAWDYLQFGNRGLTNRLGTTYLHDVDLWTDFALGGEWADGPTHEPYTPQEWEWFEWDGSGAEQLDDLGTIATVNAGGDTLTMTDPADPLTLESYELEVWEDSGSPTWTKTTGLSYGFGNKQKLDLYLPTATPPNYGWPLILWAHGGFGIGGDKSDIPEGFVTEAALNGYAVASVNYVLSEGALSVSGDPYPAWDANDDTARYPTQALDMKLAATWLQARATALTGGNGTYPIRADQLIATGYSFGGWPALAAALTRELTDDGEGVNLTLAGNTSLGYPSIADPVFLGAYTWAGPVSWTRALAGDPTEGDWNFLGTGHGTIWTTVNQFFGVGSNENPKPTADEIAASGIDSLLIANASRAVPARYAGGLSDFLVPCNDRVPATIPYDHADALGDAYTTAAGSLPAGADFEAIRQAWSTHHRAMYDYPAAEFYAFLDSLT